MLFYILFVCKRVLPPGDNPIAVNITYHLVFVTPLLLPAAIVEELELQFCLISEDESQRNWTLPSAQNAYEALTL